MSTPRRGVRRAAAQRRAAPERPDAGSQPPAPDGKAAAPATTERKATPPATRAGAPGPSSTSWWVKALEWVAWIALWASAVAAGYFFGKVLIAKVFFIAIMLAVTVLPWMRWVWRGSRLRLSRDRIAMLQGALTLFVGVVLALSGRYLLALAVVVVEFALAALILVRTPRPPQPEAPRG